MSKSKQGSGTPRRRSSWSKHTSYPTLQNEEAIHVPAEISTATRVQIRRAERRLDDSTKRLDNIQRKHLSHLDCQKKTLEKSMLAYSEKMKDIITSRANQLFREIRTRNSSRDDRIVKSPTASLKSCSSLPVKLITKKHTENRSLRGFPQVHVYSPIAERSTECTPVSRSHTFHFADKNFVKPMKHLKSKSTIDTGDTDTCSVHTEQGTILNSKVKAIPRVVVTNALPWLNNDQYDSAYSSASEELDRDFSDTASDASDRTSASTYVKQNILTVPVVHVRKNRKNRRKGKVNTSNTRKVTAPHKNKVESSILLNT